MTDGEAPAPKKLKTADGPLRLPLQWPTMMRWTQSLPPSHLYRALNTSMPCYTARVHIGIKILIREHEGTLTQTELAIIVQIPLLGVSVLPAFGLKITSTATIHDINPFLFTCCFHLIFKYMYRSQNRSAPGLKLYQKPPHRKQINTSMTTRHSNRQLLR